MSASLWIPPRTLHCMQAVQRLLDTLRSDASPQAEVVPSSTTPYGGIIVFPGSFNPPTIAHLALLKQAQHFSQSQPSPLLLYAAFTTLTIDKEQVQRPLLLDRVMLLQYLLQTRLPRVGILLLNHGLYIEQAQALRSSFPRVKHIFFLMGFDKIVQILDPRYYENRDQSLRELFSLAHLLVAPRGNQGDHELRDLLDQPQNRPFQPFIHSLPFNSQYRTISSTEVRNAVQGYRHEIPQEVHQFIVKTRAYAPPVREPDGSLLDVYGERVQALQHLLSLPQLRPVGGEK
jgi:nicotinic acid mononucleotide adenylyltransferase